MEKAASDAVRLAMARSINDSSNAVAGAFDAATRPFLKRLDDSATMAFEAQSRLGVSMARLSWQWICLAGACTGAVLIAVWVASVLFTEWQRHENLNLMEERDDLKAEVAQLRSQSEEWAKRGGRAKLETCGSIPRLCVRVDKRTAYGGGQRLFCAEGLLRWRSGDR